jgi:hypothetical protein
MYVSKNFNASNFIPTGPGYSQIKATFSLLNMFQMPHAKE